MPPGSVMAPTDKGGGTVNVRERVFDTMTPFASVTATTTFHEPGLVAVPTTAPDELPTSPAGSPEKEYV